MQCRFLRQVHVLALSFCLIGSVNSQSTQSLPSAWLNTPGSGTGFVANATADSVWQWHYDSAQFLASGPITITEIYVRSTSGASVAAFDFPSFEVTCASALTDYTTGSHSTTFAANLAADATVVRTGPWVGGPVPASGGPTSTFIPLGLTTPFVYDPTTGNDFIIQIVKCGTNAIWGANMDGASGGAGTNGGNRYGFNGSCTATTSTFSNNEFVPIVRIDYIEENILSITQSGPGVGDLSISLTNLSPTATSGWMILSADVAGSQGAGSFIGVYPDFNTWLLLTTTPIGLGNPFHFPTVAPVGFFPTSPFNLGAGAVSSLTGLTVDVAMLMVTPGPFYDSRSNLVRFTFQ